MAAAALAADDAAFLASVAGSGRDALRSLDSLVGPRRRDQLSAGGRVDALVGFERLIGWAQAQQYKLLAAMLDDPSSTGVLEGVDADKRWAQEDVQAALGISSGAAQTRLGHAEDLVHRFPGTLELMETGQISGDQARAVADALLLLDDETARAVEHAAVARSGLSLSAFRRTLRALVLGADPDAARRQRALGVAERRVYARADAPGIAAVYASLPAEDAAVLMAAVQQLADRFTRDNPADERTCDQRRADALTQLAMDHLGLTHLGTDDIEATTAAGTDDVEGTDNVEDTTAADPTAADPAAAAGGRRAAGLRPAIQVTVALSTLLGLDDQCGELDGHGPIPAALARLLAGDPSGQWRRLLTDDRGVLLDYGRSTYRPPADLRRFVQARDRSCRFPGCSHPAQLCQLDHRTRWIDGGHTNERNLHALSGRHHRAKDDHGWQPRLLPDHSTDWRSPTGHHYLVPPGTYPVDRTATGPPKIKRSDHDGDPPPF